MKKLIAVLLVVFLSCFSLVAEDIPMDWYIQIVKALDNFTARDFEEWKIEKIDEKTVKISNNKPAVVKDKNGQRDFTETIKEYYFRFNLTPEEVKNDKALFMEKAGELFSSDDIEQGKASNISKIRRDDEYEKLSSFLMEFYNNDTVVGNRTQYLDIYYFLENYSSLSLYFYHQDISDMTYYKY